MKKGIVLLLVALFAITFVMVACGEKKEEPKAEDKKVETTDTTTDTAEKTEEPDMKEVAFAEYKSFDTALLYRIEMVEFAPSYVFATLPTEAGAGSIFVKVTVGVKNETKDVVKISSLLFDAKIYDPKGTEYKSETFADGALEGDVAADTEKSGVFYFKVPGDANLDLTGWVLKMNSDEILTDKVIELPLK